MPTNPKRCPTCRQQWSKNHWSPLCPTCVARQRFLLAAKQQQPCKGGERGHHGDCAEGCPGLAKLRAPVLRECCGRQPRQQGSDYCATCLLDGGQGA